MSRDVSKARPAVDQLESLFKALADKTRLRILALRIERASVDDAASAIRGKRTGERRPLPG